MCIVDNDLQLITLQGSSPYNYQALVLGQVKNELSHPFAQTMKRTLQYEYKCNNFRVFDHNVFFVDSKKDPRRDLKEAFASRYCWGWLSFC